MSSIYHLLKGKRSIQTVQDTYIYELTPFFGILPTLTKQMYDEQINNFIVNGFVKLTKENDLLLTNKGHEWLVHNKSISLGHFNGIEYVRIDHVFLSRLLLLVQILTNRKKNNNKYIPIIDELAVTNWARQLYRKISDKTEQVTTQLYEELTTALHQLTNDQANIFVDRLTGYKTYGLSINQLATKYNVTPLDIQLSIVQITHQLLKIIANQKQTFPLLNYIAKNLPMEKFVTNSAKKTYELFKSNYSIPEIAQLRGLKVNTINDHLVEVSLYDDQFPFDRFICEQSYNEIDQVVTHNQSYKLKDIKDQINDEISYFQIRLALSKRSLKERSDLL